VALVVPMVLLTIPMGEIRLKTHSIDELKVFIVSYAPLTKQRYNLVDISLLLFMVVVLISKPPATLVLPLVSLWLGIRFTHSKGYLKHCLRLLKILLWRDTF